MAADISSTKPAHPDRNPIHDGPAQEKPRSPGIRNRSAL
jgi:hypothetical protein